MSGQTPAVMFNDLLKLKRLPLVKIPFTIKVSLKKFEKSIVFFWPMIADVTDGFPK